MKSFTRQAFAFALVPFALAVVAQGCGNENSIVGGRCAVGFDACGEQCVDPSTDARHCGKCGVVCPSGVPCVEGFCGGPDGSRDGSGDGNGDGDGSDDGGVDLDAERFDGTLEDGGKCLPPFDTAAACGDCVTRCRNPNGACLLNDAGNYECGPTCAPPLINCHGRCVDGRTDPYNCGACRKFCPSLLCQNSLCVGSNPGDVVVYGHDYYDAVAGSSQVKVLVNAMLIPSTDPLRVLSYEQFADPSAVIRLKSVVAGALGNRRVQYTVSTAEADVRSATLAERFDIVVVHDQRSATAPQLAAIGSGWQPALTSFTQHGGVVIALDGASGAGAMPTLVTTSGLLAVTSHASLAPGSAAAVVAPLDTIGGQVVSPYGVVARSATIQTSEPNGGLVTYVVRANAAGDGDPVVIHKLVPTPP